MRERVRPSADRDLLGRVCRAILNLRLLAVSVTIFYIPGHFGRAGVLLAALGLSLAVSFLALLAWPRIASTLLAHPALLALDVMLSVAILTLAGPQSPFFLYTLGSALLAGVMYRATGAGVFSFVLLAGYVGLLALRPGSPGLGDFQLSIGLPSLYPLCAVGGAALRSLLDRQTAIEGELVDAERRATILSERTRVAREMHDSVGKTLEGVALGALALSVQAERDPLRAAESALTLAAQARTAAAEARELIDDLRADDVSEPLHLQVRGVAEEWSMRSGIACRVEVTPVTTDVDSRYELLWVLKEALRNVQRHAHADRVDVLLAADGQRLRLQVCDDGVGLNDTVDREALAREGHFGVVGMGERMTRVGGVLKLRARPGGGTQLEVWAPLTPAATGAQVVLTQ